MKRMTGLVAAGAVSWAAVAGAGRPLAIDDADAVDAGQFEFEAGAGYVHADRCRHWDYPFGLTCGLARGLEAGAGFGGQFEERTEALEAGGPAEARRESGVGDLTAGAKWQFVEACPLGARHALAASLKLPTADEDAGLGSGETDVDVTWIASRSMGATAGLHLNLGHSWIGGPDDDVLHYGVALDYQIADAVQWVGEVFTEKELAGGTDAVVQYNTGFRWNPVESLTLDIAGGSKLSGEAPDFTATAGLTWALGFTSRDSKQED